MANNRLYIKCKCGDRMFIGKHYTDGWSMPDYSERYNQSFGEVLNEWHDKHIECFFKWFDNPYSIITENDEETE